MASMIAFSMAFRFSLVDPSFQVPSDSSVCEKSGGSPKTIFPPELRGKEGWAPKSGVM
jgi:hypothetical protein